MPISCTVKPISKGSAHSPSRFLEFHRYKHSSAYFSNSFAKKCGHKIKHTVVNEVIEPWVLIWKG